MDTQKPLEKAKRRLGTGRIASICDVSREAARKWLAQGHLPRTEWTGETSYARRIAAAYNQEIAQRPELGDEPMTPEQLLACKPAAAQAHNGGGAGFAAAAS